MKLSDRFTWQKLLLFAFPSIAMMIFTSIYGVVDGFFVSNYAGKSAFAAINFIMPVLMILITPGMMIGTGGSALVAKTLGEKEPERAKQQFSLLVWFAIGLGIVLMLVSLVMIKPLCQAMGASGEMLSIAVEYGTIMCFVLPIYLLQVMFQAFFVTAEKPTLGFIITFACGLANMILDWLLVGVLGWGVAGAAIATGIGVAIGGLCPIVYFARPNSSPLQLVKTRWSGRVVWQTCSNGISELLTNVSMSLVGILYNWQLLHYLGENGVSAYGVLMYVNMIFAAVFMGFTMGTAPILSYNFGAGNKPELKRLLRMSIVIILIFSVAMWGSCETFDGFLTDLFVGYDPELHQITMHAFSIYAWSFLFMGMAVYGSGFFTALNDGLDSALISIFRTLVFQLGAIILFPLLWGVEGIWTSIVFAELAAFTLVFVFLKLKQKKFGY